LDDLRSRNECFPAFWICDQVQIALANASADEVTSLVLQALRWTLRLAGECSDRDLPVAEWIAEALA
jgi:hypothetical protein